MRVEDVLRASPALREVFAAEPEVLAAWLFGSVARDRATPESDVDFAVLLRDHAPQGLERLALLDAIAERLARLLGTSERRIDVVAIDEQGPVFQHGVLASGHLVYERDPRQRLLFACSVTRRYLDFKPTLDIFDRAKYRGPRP